MPPQPEAGEARRASESKGVSSMEGVGFPPSATFGICVLLLCTEGLTLLLLWNLWNSVSDFAQRRAPQFLTPKSDPAIWP